jgi:lipopolysaccharide transport system permease protein
MVRRQIRVEFDQMYLGFFWAIARPLIMVLVFVLLRDLSQARLGVTIPYALYLFSGLILWFYFIESVMETAASVQRDAGLIQKVYFPRLMSPIATVLAGLYGFGIAAVPLAVMMVYYGVYPSWSLLLLPLVLAQVLVLILGLGCVFAALTLSNRDWQKFLAFSLYVGLFVSPVIYSPDMIPERVRDLYYLNPMAGTLLAFRSTLFQGLPFPLGQWLFSIGVSGFVLLFGLVMFQRVERVLVDRI